MKRAEKEANFTLPLVSLCSELMNEEIYLMGDG
jgi:hypothetical protein